MSAYTLVPNYADLFDRFFRVGESVEESGTGTGLGLAVSQELVRLMKGKILVNSIPGEVTTFTVIMPVTNEAMISEGPEFGGPGEISPLVPDGRTDINTDRSTEESDEPLLLIVEDNTDLVQYLTAILQKEYRVESASNGREGLEKVLDRMPDIVLSDVMMPEMDGITMLQKIKEDQRSSHIPVVMLTAKADIASRLEGLERGADAYLAKPFNAEELLVQLRNLIRTRRLLFERYSAMDSLPQTDDRALQMEDDFILRVREIMELHLDDENFGIIRLCEEIGMSRAQLYRKFKVLTDKTVNDYLRDYRLHRAKCLLESTRINVSEAAYRVGFKNLSHFSRVFTETYGINPSGVGKEDRH